MVLEFHLGEAIAYTIFSELSTVDNNLKVFRMVLIESTTWEPLLVATELAPMHTLFCAFLHMPSCLDVWCSFTADLYLLISNLPCNLLSLAST